MSFLDEVLADTGPIGREVTMRGKVGMVYFRRITAGERQILLKGQRVTQQAGAGSASIDLDLEKNELARQHMVLFSVCKEDGSKVFADLKAVQHAGSDVVGVLYRHAAEVNSEKDEETPGNG